MVRYRRKDHLVSVCAFDLLELNGQDMRDRPLEERKAALKMLLRRSHPGIAYNRHFDVEGSIVFHQACKLGCEGIVSKRLGSPHRSGRSADWIKVKNPATPAVKREAEERKIELFILPTAQAIEMLNEDIDDTNAVLHVTC